MPKIVGTHLHGELEIVAVATGDKHELPNSAVFNHKRDRYLAVIGTVDIIHATAKEENLTVIFINNKIYGMIEAYDYIFKNKELIF